MQKFLNRKKGAFTLVEILVVILIIGLLFVFLVPKIDSATDKARETGIKTDFRSYQTAFEAVARENSGFAAGTGTFEERVNGYLDPALEIDTATHKTAKKDPWNKEYVVSVQPNAAGNLNNGVITIVTGGKDTVADAATKVTVPFGTGADADKLQLVDFVDPVVADNSHDYILATEYVNGQIFTQTAGFTTNIMAK